MAANVRINLGKDRGSCHQVQHVIETKNEKACRGKINFILRWNLFQFNCYGKQSNLACIDTKIDAGEAIEKKVFFF
jgi:hypothetical protein